MVSDEAILIKKIFNFSNYLPFLIHSYLILNLIITLYLSIYLSHITIIYIFFKIRSKGSKPQLERRVMAEHFCCENTPPLQENLIKISVLISLQLSPYKTERYVMNQKSGWSSELFEKTSSIYHITMIYIYISIYSAHGEAVFIIGNGQSYPNPNPLHFT